MNMKFWKWWLTINVAICAFTIGEINFSIIDFLLITDSTFLTFFILTIAIGFIIYILINYKKVVEKKDNDLLWFTSDAVLSLGMIGTLIGFLIVLGGAFIDIDPNNIESMTLAITTLANGMSTALVTTLVGLSVGLWMKLQLVLLESE